MDQHHLTLKDKMKCLKQLGLLSSLLHHGLNIVCTKRFITLCQGC
jgi:hypothetical protein